MENYGFPKMHRIISPFFEGYKFHRFRGFLGFPQNLFHQKLADIHSIVTWPDYRLKSRLPKYLLAYS